MVFLLLIPLNLFLPQRQIDCFQTSRIIGLDVEGDIRVYPLAILNWHEIVNDTVGELLFQSHFTPSVEPSIGILLKN